MSDAASLPPLVFAGTPEFAAVALRALLAAGARVPLVLTQPDRPAGRGMKLVASPVKQVALAHGIRVEQPETLRAPEAQAMLQAAIAESGAQVMVVAAYGLILPQSVLDMPAKGCLNIHGSLLPRWRGAAPIQRAIAAGDAETGIGIMQMEAGLDTGPVLLEGRLPISDTDTGATLHDKLAVLGGELIVDALRRLDTLQPAVQPAEGVTYAHKLSKAEAALDFRKPAAELARLVRAFDPFPGCTAQLGSDICKIWSAMPVEGSGQPGEVLAVGKTGIVVACGEGALCITALQKPGGRRLPVQDFLAGSSVKTGDFFAITSA